VRHFLPMSGFVYILQSEKNGRYYIGSTNNPDHRLQQHNSGFVAATLNKGPWIRVALVEFATPTMARKAEHHLKRQKSRRATMQVIDGTYAWPDFQ